MGPSGKDGITFEGKRTFEGKGLDRDHRRDVCIEFFIKQTRSFGPGSNLGSTLTIAKFQHLVS